MTDRHDLVYLITSLQVFFSCPTRYKEQNKRHIGARRQGPCKGSVGSSTLLVRLAYDVWEEQSINFPLDRHCLLVPE